VDAARNCVNPRRDRSRYDALCSHINALWGRNYSCICQCRSCAFGFAVPFIAGDAKFYNTAYERAVGEYPRQKWEYRIAKDALAGIIARAANDGVRLLEIGAGSGAFLHQVVPRLIKPEDVFCTEYSDHGAAQIRQLGIGVQQADIRSMEWSTHRTFDVVCMFQVLEHTDRLSELFSTLRAITSSRADLLIAVPNSRRNQFNEDNGAVLDMPPNHIGRWARSSFESLAEREGWTMVQYREEPVKPLRSWRVFSMYRYARASQFDGSLSARIAGLPRGTPRRILEIATVAAFAVRSVGHLPALLSAGMGESVFVQLRRRE
jgi:hypothetical protein